MGVGTRYLKIMFLCLIIAVFVAHSINITKNISLLSPPHLQQRELSLESLQKPQIEQQ